MTLFCHTDNLKLCRFFLRAFSGVELPEVWGPCYPRQQKHVVHTLQYHAREGVCFGCPRPVKSLSLDGALGLHVLRLVSCILLVFQQVLSEYQR